MAETRVQMPNGETLRTRSTRRYVVGVYNEQRAAWQVEYRSDSEGNALAKWRAYARLNWTTNLIDTTTKSVIR